MKKRMVSLLLVFALLLTMAGCGSSKNTSESTTTENTTQAPVVDSNLEAGSGWEPAESFSGGTGTESDPYQLPPLKNWQNWQTLQATIFIASSTRSGRSSTEHILF